MKNTALALLRLSIAGFFVSALSAAPVTILVSPPIARADGSLVNGVVNVQWQAFTSAQGVFIPAGTIRNAPIINGIFVPSIALEPNVGASPSGTSYRVQYTLSGSPAYSRQWYVPNSSTPVPLQNIEFPIQGLVGTTAIVNPTQLMQGGATLGQPLCWLGAYWGPGNCGGGGGGGANPLVLTKTVTPPDPSDGAGPALRLGYYQSGDFGYINSNNTGVGGKPLVIQPSGAGDGPVCFFNSSCSGPGTVQISNQDSGGISQAVIVSGPNQISSTSSLFRVKANDANPDRTFIDYLFNFTAPQVIANDTVGGVAGAALQAHAGLLLANNNTTSWSSTAVYSGLVDTRLVRDSAGTVAVDNGTLGQYGNLKARSLISTGAAGFTTNLTGQFGYDTVGFFHGGINGTDEIAVFRATSLPTNGNCAQWSASGVLGVAASPCGSGGGTVDVSAIKSAQYIALASASSTAYAGCPFVSVSALGAGQVYFVNVDVANSTTTPTLNVCTLGAKTIINFTGTPLVVNQLAAGLSYFFYYDGSAMRLLPIRPVADGSGTISVNSAGAIGVTSGIFATLSGGNALTGSYNFSGASFTAPFRLSLTAPATCNASAKEFYFNTSSNLLYACTATNIWTLPVVAVDATAIKNGNYFVTSGTGTAYTGTPATAPTSLQAGQTYYVAFNVPSASTAPTLSINSLAAITLVHDNGTALVVGEVGTTGYCNAFYDGTNIQLTGSCLTGPATITMQGNTSLGIPAAGFGNIGFDTTAKVPKGKASDGTLSAMVIANACPGQVVQSISADGVILCGAGGGGSPGGSNKECQYNNVGAFGGIASSDCSGTNFIIPRAGTFGANGRVTAMEAGGSGDGIVRWIDSFFNPIYARAVTNGIDASTLWVGPIAATSGVALWYRGGMQLVPSGSIYTCNSGTRGMFWVTDSGAGVKDLVQVCAKDAADVYAWRTIY